MLCCVVANEAADAAENRVAFSVLPCETIEPVAVQPDVSASVTTRVAAGKLVAVADEVRISNNPSVTEA